MLPPVKMTRRCEPVGERPLPPSLLVLLLCHALVSGSRCAYAARIAVASALHRATEDTAADLEDASEALSNSITNAALATPSPPAVAFVVDELRKS